MLKRKLLVSAILATLSSATLAAAPGFYVGGQLGWSKADYAASDYVDLTAGSVDNTGMGGRLSAGYQFNQNWAAELGYTKYANAKFKNARDNGAAIADGTLKLDAWDVVGKGILPLDNGFDVFAKLGMSYVKGKQADGLADAGFKDFNKWRPTYGLGGSYNFNQNVVADVSWVRVQNGSEVRNLDLLSAGVSYHFG